MPVFFILSTTTRFESSITVLIELSLILIRLLNLFISFDCYFTGLVFLYHIEYERNQSIKLFNNYVKYYQYKDPIY